MVLHELFAAFKSFKHSIRHEARRPIIMILSEINYNIQYHPEKDKFPIESGSSVVSSSCCLREFFIANVASGLLIKDLIPRLDFCRAAL